MDELLELEIQGWNALASSEQGAATRFYADVLHEDAVMLFPGGMVLEGKQPILDSLSVQPWKHFKVDDSRVIPLGEAAGVLTYRVTAQREGAQPYVALISSTYIRSGGSWKLRIHQHTPVG